MNTRQIIDMIARGNLYPFYNSKAWRRLSHEVMHEQHNECQVCRAKGKHTKARLVHHVNEVKVRPDLAMERFYQDEHGNLQRNLLALCQNCHEDQHPDRFKTAAAGRKKFTNEEKW